MQICNRPRLDNHVEKYMLINVLKEILPVWLFQHVPKESDDHVKVSVRQLLGNLRTDLRGRIIIRGKLYRQPRRAGVWRQSRLSRLVAWEVSRKVLER